MMRAFARSLVCVVVCASLTGCGSSAGKVAGALAAATAATVVAGVLSSSSHRSRSNGDDVSRAVPARIAYRADQEAPIPTTCEAKRREFLWVYGSSRRLPPQLHCTEDGDFGGAALHGSHAVAGLSDDDD
ncbi:Hypothetical protein A7982_02853 [Minicystis rosea]|nr:Hypothetical protein A7982_02853 [Minicystis rosea]